MTDFSSLFNHRRVALTEFENGVEVSTVRLPGDPPCPFETIAFGWNDDHATRCETEAEAIQNHEQTCRMIEAAGFHRKIQMN